MQLVSPHVIKNELNEIYNDTIKCMISESASYFFFVWKEFERMLLLCVHQLSFLYSKYAGGQVVLGNCEMKNFLGEFNFSNKWNWFGLSV